MILGCLEQMDSQDLRAHEETLEPLVILVWWVILVNLDLQVRMDSPAELGQAVLVEFLDKSVLLEL